MERIFEPITWGYVDAEKTHGKGAEYYVAIGNEHWNVEKNPILVFKIQMSYDRRRSGRKSPSFPLDSDDWNRVCKKAKEVKEAYDKGIKREV